jgi:hypothetical protein
VLGLTARRPRLLAIVPAVLAVELVANGLIGQGAGYTLSGVGIEKPGTYLAWAPLRKPDVDVAAYTRPTKIARALQGSDARYISLAFEGLHRDRGYLLLQRPRYWGLLANQRSMIFRIRDAQGYNPAQLYRYWSFVRAVDPKYIKYNASFFTRDANPVAQDVLQIGWTVAPAALSPTTTRWPGARVLTDGEWSLSQLPETPAPASPYERWTAADSPDEALRAVLASSFDPARDVVIEDAPPVPSPRGPQLITPRVDVRSLETQAITLDVHSNRALMVLVRIPFDTGWHAELDGHDAEVLHADYVDMAVAVPAGTHTIRLGYGDPSIGAGLIASAISLAALAAAALLLRRRKRQPAG